jgi:hypothetical protein
MDSSRPFRVEEFRVKRARPFKSVDDVRKALRDYKEGRSIGFSRKASLIAMGLLPRANGRYKVSEKYQ